MFKARSGHIIQRGNPFITSCNRISARGLCRSQHHVRGQQLGCTGNGIAYRCPTCSQLLTDKDRNTLVCENGHTSLRAKEGYVHLHPSGRKAAVNAAGDAAEMVKARRRFLDAGHYDIVADEISRIVAQVAGSGGQVYLLDAGCGEGTYTGRVSMSLQQFGTDCAAFGVDVAKTAIRMAAKRHKDVSFAVASSYRLPFEDKVFDAVICTFAPTAAEEFARVLRSPDGLLIIAHPGEDHLKELKQILYKQFKSSNEDLHQSADLQLAGFEHVQNVRLRKDMTLTLPEAHDLLGMTPYAWRAPQDIEGIFGARSTFNVALDMLLSVFRKTFPKRTCNQVDPDNVRCKRLIPSEETSDDTEELD